MVRNASPRNALGGATFLVVVAFALFAWPPAAAAAQTDDPDVIGLVRNDGFAYLHYGWTGSSWRGVGQERLDGTEIYFVDLQGDRERDVLGPTSQDAPFHLPTTAHALSTLQDRADPDGWYRRPIGYFVTRDVGHTPFLPVESPLTDQEWEELLAEVRPPPADTVPDRLSIRVWRAALGSESVTYFAVDRQGDLSPGCPPLFRFTGWFGEAGRDPVFTGMEVGDCDGKGSWQRQPYALLRRGGALFLLIGRLGWEDDAADLLRLEEGELVPAAIVTSP